MQFFGYTVDKSYIFLLCNSLLVFIAINSAPINQSDQNSNENISHSEFNVSYTAAPIADEHPVETESPEEEQEQEQQEAEEQEEEESLVTLEAENVLPDTNEDDEEENALMFIVEDEHEEYGDETEELNKKCEDFIKKMKAAFCSESEPIADGSFYFGYQKSLVVVN